MLNSKNALNSVIDVVKKHAPELSFTMLDIGALPIGNVEPFYWLGEHFPNSRIIGFEVDDEVCRNLNARTPSAFEFHAKALGRIDGEVPFYITKQPMCSSLYKPNDQLTRYFNFLEMSELDRETTIRTTTLDTFCQQNGIDQIDFIKVDVQGAELDIFQSGVAALANTVMIFSEVEFVPMYEHQPLFGDVCSFLMSQGFMFHKFATMSGRAIKPMIIQNDPNTAVQLMWGDAVFIRDIRTLGGLSSEQLLRLAIFGCMYGSLDLTFHCLGLYDARENTGLSGQLMSVMKG